MLLTSEPGFVLGPYSPAVIRHPLSSIDITRESKYKKTALINRKHSANSLDEYERLELTVKCLYNSKF